MRSTQPTTLTSRIESRLKALKKTARGASLEAGLGASTIRNIFQGQSESPRGKTLTALAKVLQTSESWLLNGSGEEVRTQTDQSDHEQLGDVEHPEESPTFVRPEPVFFDHTNRMPVYSAAEGGSGELIVDTDPIDWVPRPHTLQHVKKAYAVVVTGDSMHPAFKPGDQAWVNPKLRPNPGEDCIVYRVEHDIGEERALIKEYVKQTPTHWIVKQYNPEKELHLPKTDWVRIYRVVGKFSR
jgi:phage repressor protein C with HTH and peptisase S24 domain